MERKENISRKVGDAIEKVGQKISNTGAKDLGDKVFNAGDKLEHRDEHQSDKTTKTW
jgi:hypothetical protein